MDDTVSVVYSEYGSNQKVEKIEFSLIDNILLRLTYKDKHVVISLIDSINDNIELEGTLTYSKLNILIRGLSNISNQFRQEGINL